MPPPLRVPTELSQRVLWVFEIGTCSSGFQKSLCFHLPRQLPPLPLLQPPRWMKHLAVFQGLSHLHPDPLQGITEVFAPQLSTPVGRLQERKKNKKKQKTQLNDVGQTSTIFNKETGASSGDQEETRKKPGRRGVSTRVECSDGFMRLNGASQGTLLKSNGLQSDCGM